MLNPEQTIIRRRENENRLLRQENAMLKDKLKNCRYLLADLIREIAKSVNIITRIKLNEMADEINNLD